MSGTTVQVPDLKSRLISGIDPEWTRDVLGRMGVAGEGGLSCISDKEFAVFLEYMLCTDVRHYWKGDERGDDAAGEEANAPGRPPWFVQVEHVEDISQPCTRRYVPASTSNSSSSTSLSSAQRMLKLLVFDGEGHHVAIEHQRLSFSANSGWPRLGCKLLIDPGAVVRSGMYLLTPSTCGVLGGVVEEFEQRQRVVESVLAEPVYGRRGGPLGLEAWREGVAKRVREKGGRDNNNCSSNTNFNRKRGAEVVDGASDEALPHPVAPAVVNMNNDTSRVDTRREDVVVLLSSDDD